MAAANACSEPEDEDSDDDGVAPESHGFGVLRDCGL